MWQDNGPSFLECLKPGYECFSKAPPKMATQTCKFEGVKCLSYTDRRFAQ